MMSNPPTSFADWQSYPETLDPIHVAWLRQAKRSKTDFVIADIEGGEMISLTTVEEEILGVWNDKDLEIAATCLPDQLKGEKIVLLATSEQDKDKLRKLLSDANINPLFYPSKVLIVDEIPKLGSGKN